MEQQEVDFSGTEAVRLNTVPPAVRQVAAARAIRWFGWGFGETLLPVFILMFSASLTEAGLVNAAYDVVFLLSVPIVGLIADAVSSKTLLIVGLLIYPFIGASLYLGGITGVVSFVILARALNGLSYCLDSIGMDTYIRRLGNRKGIASAFGYTASLANFSWLLSALIGAYLVQFVSIGALLFLITPFALLAMIPLAYAPKDKPVSARKLTAFSIGKPLVNFLKEIAAMKKGLRAVVFLMFTLDVASVAATFFIPIEAYRNGASLSAVILLVVISAAPSLSEFWLAEFIDGSKYKRRTALIATLVALPLLFMAASMTPTYVGKIVVALGIETAAILGTLALQSYATMLSRRDRYGQVASVLEGASTFGDLAGPIAIGLLTDLLGFSYMFVAMSVCLALVGVYFIKNPIER